MKKPLFIIMAGDGINCERETAAAFNLAGAETKILHITDIAANPKVLETAEGLALPGGFSFGDELGSGQILALKIRHILGDSFLKMVTEKKPIIGICNGFQALMKLGLLPFPDARVAALATNAGGAFIDRWVTLDVQPESVCLWTKDLPFAEMELPIRHGEGRIVFQEGAENRIYETLVRQGQIPLTYRDDVNGSHQKIAALTDHTGTILGLMPHPEAFVSSATYKNTGHTGDGHGLLIFKNIVRYIKGEEQTHARRTA